MAKIANVALTNTFDTWRSRSNEAFDRLSQFAINNSSLYANTLTSNVAFTAKGTATVTGLLTASGRATVGTNLTVSGNTTLGAANKTITTTGAWTHTGWGSLSTNLTVSGNTTLGGANKFITIGGAASTLTIGGAGHVSNTTGWFGVAGRASVSTNLFVGGNTAIGSAIGGGTSPKLSVVSGSSFFGVAPSTYASLILGPRPANDGYGTINYNWNGIASTSFWYSDWGSSTWQLNHYKAGAAVLGIQVANNGVFTATKSATIGVNLTVSGNTTLNGTTTDKSNALSQTLTDGATINWDVALGRVATVTLGAAGRTMAAPTNLKVGTYILRVYQDGTGSRTITTWNSVFKWTAAVAPVLSTGAGKLDIITFFSDGTNLYGSYLPDMR